MATDPNGLIEGYSEAGNDLNPNRSNDGNSGSPPTIPEIEPSKAPEIEPGKIPGVDPETDPAIEPEIEPGKIPDDSYPDDSYPDDSLIPHKSPG
jgi:hypothetical protein